MSQSLIEESNLIEFINQMVNPFYHELLTWINPKLPDREKADGFGDEWSDGTKLVHVVNAVAPGFIDGEIDLTNVEEGQALLDRIERDLDNPCPFSYANILAGNYDPKIMAAYLNRFRDIKNPHTEDELMKWLTCMLHPSEVTNLTDEWKDGRLLSYLVEAINPNSLTLDDKYEEKNDEEKCDSAINVGKTLGIQPRHFTPQELASGKVDKYRMRQYLGDYMDHFMHENRDLVRDAKRGLRDTINNKYPELITSANSLITTADKRELAETVLENYDFSFPMESETISQLNEDHAVTTAFLYKLKQAPLRPPATPIYGKEEPNNDMRESLNNSVPKAKSPDLSGVNPHTALLSNPNSSAAKRRKRRIRTCICIIVTLATIAVILVLIGVFAGLAKGVWNL